jgi:hypothetical protein
VPARSTQRSVRVGSALWLAAAGMLGVLGGQASAAETTPPAAPANAAATDPAAGNESPLDYRTLSHTVSVEFLRAGSHDPSGVNQYYFQARMLGLINSSEERNTETAKRKQVVVELGTFGETTIDSLAYWRPDEKAQQIKELKIDGDAIRELSARVMQEFKAQENDVAVLVSISLFEKAKQWIFFGEDTYVGRAEYFPIPQSKFDTPLRTDSTLAVADDKGTLVKLRIHYDTQAGRASAP